MNFTAQLRAHTHKTVCTDRAMASNISLFTFRWTTHNKRTTVIVEFLGLRQGIRPCLVLLSRIFPNFLMNELEIFAWEIWTRYWVDLQLQRQVHRNSHNNK